MGNTSSSGSRGHHDESVDYGSLLPQGVYTGPRDWNHAIVSQLIVARKLAPFYRPLEEFEESWDDDQILAARKEFSPQTDPDHPTRSDSVHPISSKSNQSKRSVPNREQSKGAAAVYRGAVECPICFMYYPPNINHSRCCDQAICTECFVQIKRNEPTTTHLVSEPAACPYCVQDNFGIVYRAPQWRAGMGSDGSTSQWPEPPKDSAQPPTHKRRQKSYSADSPEVVTTDQIRPDWEAKLAAVRAAVARRANRRIIMRQVGDRLIPVGVTSGRIHALNPEEAGTEIADGGGSRRRRRHGGNSQLEHYMTMPGQDLEELMLMEAMRLSLIEHEEQQRKEAGEKRKQEAAAVAAAISSGESGSTPAELGPSSSATPPSNPSIPSLSQVSLAPVSTSPTCANGQRNSNIDTSSSDTGGRRKSRPNSRSRASPPPPTSLSNNHELMNGPSWGTQGNSHNPSSLNAPLACASTVTATPSSSTLNGDKGEQGRPPLPPKATQPSASVPMAGAKENTSSLSFNTRDSASTSVNHDDDDDDDESVSHSYRPLPSSPDSGVINEPLLGGAGVGSNRKVVESGSNALNGAADT